MFSCDLHNIRLLLLLPVASAEYLDVVGWHQACPALTPSQQPAPHSEVEVEAIFFFERRAERKAHVGMLLPGLGMFGRQSDALPYRHAELLLPVRLEGVEDCGQGVITYPPHPGPVLLVTGVLEK